MPSFTTNYRLGVKLATEPYLASLDKSRFTIIDNQFGGFSDIIGDGRISGWNISGSDGSDTVLVSSGMGIIDKFVCQTFGGLEVTLPNDGMYSFFMQRKIGVWGGYSDFSIVHSATVQNTLPPSAPSASLSGDGSYTRTYNAITLSWEPNQEPDISGYDIYYRNMLDADFTLYGFTEESSISVSSLSPESGYYFQIIAKDLSGNESLATSVNLPATPIYTLADERVPLDPSGIRVFSGNSVIQVAWTGSADTFVSGYDVSLQKMKGDGSDDGVPTVRSLGSSVFTTLFSGLSNGVQYRATVKSKTAYGFLSSGISVLGIPSHNAGPDEVSSFVVTQSEYGVDSVLLNISWVLPVAPSVPADKVVITLTENNTIISDPIVLPSTMTSYTIHTFISSGSVFSVKEMTSYSVRVQCRSTGRINNIGIVENFTTQKFSLPDATRNLSIQISDNVHLSAFWNPPSSYDHFLVSLEDTDADDVTTTLVANLDVGKSTSYLYSSTPVEEGHRYTITVKSVDVASNQCATPETSSVLVEEFETPPSPEATATSYAGAIRLDWLLSGRKDIASYKIWRAEKAQRLLYTDFVLLDTVSAFTTSFYDYSIDTSKTYAYLITTVDVFGNESSGPGTNEMSMNILYIKTASNTLFAKPSGLNGSVLNEFDYQLTWTAATDFFDGYQIYRSNGNLGDFVLVDYADPGDTSYVDENVLLTHGDVLYYMIRKFRNTADVFVSGSSSLPDHCVSLGTVLISGGVVANHLTDIDQSSAIELYGLQEPISSAASTKIADHHHVFVNDSDDRRIRLSDSITVSDWTSENNYTYTTETDISNTLEETIYISGQEYTGIYYLSREEKSLTFEEQLSDEATVSLVFTGMGETTGTLPSKRIHGIYANKITNGVLDKNVIGNINHEGRIGDVLRPIRTPLRSSDFFTYSGGSIAKLGTTFFDVIQKDESGVLLAATSVGVMRGEDSGATWTLAGSFSQPISRIFKFGTSFYVLATNTVYRASSLATDWEVYPGLDYVHCIRDAISDSSNNVYISTDIGVFVLRNDILEKRWILCSETSGQSTNCYALSFDASSGRIIVSTDEGIYYSSDSGGSWNVWTAYTGDFPIVEISVDSSLPGDIWTLALTKNSFYRKEELDVSFEKVADFDSPSQRFEICRNRAYVSTENGILLSDGDVRGGFSLSFDKVLPQLGEFGKSFVCPALLSTTTPSDRLFIGTDQRFYASPSHGLVHLQYSDVLKTSPTVYVEGKEKSLGVYFNSSYISFQDRLSETDSVEVSTAYNVYVSDRGGWADIDHTLPIKLYVNGVPINDPLLTRYQTDVNGYSITYDPLTSRNCDLIAAESAAEKISLSETVLNAPEGFTPTNLSSLMKNVQELEGVVYGVNITVPSITASLFKTSYSPVCLADTANGVFDISSSLSDPHDLYFCWKYSTVTADVIGTTIFADAPTLTHKEIDNSFENSISGLPSGLADVHQINQVRQFIGRESSDPGGADTVFPGKHVEIMANPDLSWYSKKRSTMGYKLRLSKSNSGISISYPSCVLYIPDAMGGASVWVGGLQGVVSIELSSQQTNFILYGGVRFMARDGDLVRIIIDDKLYSVDVKNSTTPILDDGFGEPTGLTSVASINNLIFIGGIDGVYVKRTNKVWEKVLNAVNAHVGYFGDLAYAFDSENGIYSSSSGESWTDRGRLLTIEEEEVSIVGMYKYDSIVFSTDQGCYSDAYTFYATDLRLGLFDIKGGEDVSESKIPINDIAVSGTRMVVAAVGATYYEYNTMDGTFSSHDMSSYLKAIHKIAIIIDDIWLFGYDLAVIVPSVGDIRTVELATGNRLSWE